MSNDAATSTLSSFAALPDDYIISSMDTHLHDPNQASMLEHAQAPPTRLWQLGPGSMLQLSLFLPLDHMMSTMQGCLVLSLSPENDRALQTSSPPTSMALLAFQQRKLHEKLHHANKRIVHLSSLLNHE
jgi:hypothetical protein